MRLQYYLFAFILVFGFKGISQLSEEQFIADSLKIVKLKLVRPQVKFDNRINFYGDTTLFSLNKIYKAYCLSCLVFVFSKTLIICFSFKRKRLPGPRT